MTVIRRLHAVPEPTKMAVLEGEAFAKVNSIPNAEPWFRTAVVTCAAYAKLIVANRIADSVEYEPDPDLSATEQVALTGTVGAIIAREVPPCAPDAWLAEGSEKIGNEIIFTRYFYRPEQLRTLAEIDGRDGSLS